MKCKAFNIRLAEEHANDEIDLNNFMKDIEVKRIFTAFNGMFWSVLIFYREISNKEISNKTILNPTEEIVLSSEEQKSYDALRTWRSEQAKKDGMQPYIIAHNLSLKQMVKMHVKTKDELLSVKGFGAKRVEKYGDNILKVIESISH